MLNSEANDSEAVAVEIKIRGKQSAINRLAIEKISVDLSNSNTAEITFTKS